MAHGPSQTASLLAGTCQRQQRTLKYTIPVRRGRARSPDQQAVDWPFTEKFRVYPVQAGASTRVC